MPTSVSRAALLVIVAATLSCRSTTVPEWEVRIAEGEWARHGSASYRITVTRACFCFDEMMGPVVVDVVDGAIRSRHYEATGAPVPERYANIFPSIDGLFEIIETARRERRQLAVAFHPTYGYPTRIAIDMDQRPVDGGITWEARNLVLR